MPPSPDDVAATLRRENATLREQNTHLLAVVEELRGVVTELRKQVASQQAHIHRLVKLTFGRSSERVEGPTLFDGTTPPEPPAPPVPIGGPPKTPRTRAGHGRRPKPKDLPRERVEIDLTEAEKACPCCREMRVRIGEDVAERLDYRPASVFVRELVRPTYLCRACERKGEPPQIVRAPLPADPLPRSGIGAGLLAHVIVSKFSDHLPLHRQEAILARHGWDVSRSTLCDLLRRCGVLLDPLYRAMVDRMKQSFAIHADDTPITLLRPRRTAYAWVYLGDAPNPYTVFDLTPGRSQQYPAAFLKDFTGYLHADAYAGFNPVHGDGRRHLGCWMHARRKFTDANETDPQAVEALAVVRTLYAVEREAKEQNRTGDDLVAWRRTRAGPILTQFSDWLEEHHRTALPKSAFGQAVEYARNQWPSLIRYVEDHRFVIDNGPAEQAIRPLAVGRAYAQFRAMRSCRD
jgi:transposase